MQPYLDPSLPGRLSLRIRDEYHPGSYNYYIVSVFHSHRAEGHGGILASDTKVRTAGGTNVPDMRDLP